MEGSQTETVRFYATFGFGTENRYRYQIIEAPTEQQARDLMFKHHGPNWAFMYDEEEFEGQVEKFGLTPLPGSLIEIEPTV